MYAFSNNSSAACSAPLVSTSSLPVCQGCPVNHYWDGPDTCAPCPPDTNTTGIQGAREITGCRGMSHIIIPPLYLLDMSCMFPNLIFPLVAFFAFDLVVYFSSLKPCYCVYYVVHCGNYVVLASAAEYILPCSDIYVLWTLLAILVSYFNVASIKPCCNEHLGWPVWHELIIYWDIYSSKRSPAA